MAPPYAGSSPPRGSRSGSSRCRVAVGAVLGTAWPWVAVAGVVVWLVGLVFEAVGDAQLRRYKARPREERPPVIDSGLWGWTRHPNYFGDACVWWGLWLVAAPGGRLAPRPAHRARARS